MPPRARTPWTVAKTKTAVITAYPPPSTAFPRVVGGGTVALGGASGRLRGIVVGRKSRTSFRRGRAALLGISRMYGRASERLQLAATARWVLKSVLTFPS